MLALFGAIIAAVRSALETRFGLRFRMIAVTVVVIAPLVGCIPAGGALVGADPADPSARVAAVGYRSTVAPYTSLRPTTPKAWRDQNERTAPSPKSGQ